MTDGPPGPAPGQPAGQPPAGQPAETVCSAKGCRAPAAWVLVWNNPRLHTPDRRKTWLACDAHREHLAAFLGARGFLRDTVPLDRWQAGGPGPAD